MTTYFEKIFFQRRGRQLGGMKKGARYGPFFMRKLSVFLAVKASEKSERKELYITAFRFNLNFGIFLKYPFFQTDPSQAQNDKNKLFDLLVVRCYIKHRKKDSR